MKLAVLIALPSTEQSARRERESEVFSDEMSVLGHILGSMKVESGPGTA